jgi:hypothetical protein
MNGVVGIAAGLCAAIVIACSSAHQAGVARPLAPAIADGNPGGDTHAQIEQLAAAVAADRDRMGLAAPVEPRIAGVAGVAEPMSTPLSSQDPSCHHGTGDRCTTSCTLSDSICTNAAKICELAHQLAGDTWAADKCTSSQTTCEAAHAKCCACQP